MSAVAEATARHLEQLGTHTCCWIVDGERCGLWCGHDRDHLPYVPGSYLRPAPELHPLDLLRLRLARWPQWMSCPLCGVGLLSWESKRVGLTVWVFDSEQRAGELTAWRFRPCGCEAWEVQR